MAKNDRPEQSHKSFSERYGYRPARSVFQVDSIDEPLRNGLLTALDLHVLNPIENADSYFEQELIQGFLTTLWVDHYKLRLKFGPEPPYHWHLFRTNRLKDGPWYELYDFIEYSLNYFPFSLSTDKKSKQLFKSLCNRFLEREMSAWRIIGNQVVQLTSYEEIEAVEAAQAIVGKYEPVATHISTALRHLSDRKSPDYRNSIKEAISAVESMCRIITNDPKATLGDALKKLEKAGVNLHPSLKIAFGKLYGYTSDQGGIRHSLLDQSSIDFEDAKFMLVSCSAFVNLLKARSIRNDFT
jgi:hypothetical protein